MPYVGPVSSVWIWHPSVATISEIWRTLITEFETGAEQRRSKWNNSKAIFKYQFERGVLTTDEVQDIWRFYQRQRGAYGSFLAPAYGNVMTRITTAYVGSFEIFVEQTQDFTWDPSSHWNRFYLESWNGTYDYFQVASIENATQLYICSASVNSFQLGAWVVPVIKGRFTEDIYSVDYLAAMLTTVGLGITEVRS